MKRLVIPVLACCLCCVFASALSAQKVAEISEVAILKKDGTPITENERTDFKTLKNGFEFRYKDQPVRLLFDGNPETGVIVHRIESPLLKDGTISIGIRFPSERHIPTATVTDNQVLFGNKEKTALVWRGDATFVAPPSRKKLDILLAEYGAEGKWIDVTDQVKKLQSNDMLGFEAGNALFGDPIGGVVKSFIITYTLTDEDGEDEIIGNYTENQAVRIQYDAKQLYFGLKIERVDAFEFAIGPGKLPAVLPSFPK